MANDSYFPFFSIPNTKKISKQVKKTKFDQMFSAVQFLAEIICTGRLTFDKIMFTQKYISFDSICYMWTEEGLFT